MAESEAEGNLFGEWWDDLNLSLGDSIIKPITIKEITPIILKYEYLGCMPGWSEFAFAQLFDGHIGGVLVFGHTTGSNIAFTKMLPNEKVLVLQRGVHLHWTPKNSASFMISKVCKWIKSNTDYTVITATSDEEAGEIGTIYQALNWVYCGKMTHGHPVFLIDGKEIHPKTLYDIHGTSSVPKIKELYGERVEVRKRLFKHRYIHPLYKNTEKEHRINRLPYPKRKTDCEDGWVEEDDLMTAPTCQTCGRPFKKA